MGNSAIPIVCLAHAKTVALVSMESAATRVCVKRDLVEALAKRCCQQLPLVGPRLIPRIIPRFIPRVIIPQVPVKVQQMVPPARQRQHLLLQAKR